MREKLLLVALFAGLLLASLPAAAQAADGDRRGFTLRVNGDVDLPASQTVGTVIVIRGDAVIAGTVKDALVVIDGKATVSGRVEGDITVINGDLELRGSSRVNNVNLVRSDLVRAPGAEVTGDIHRRENLVFRGAWAAFGLLFWAGLTLAVIAAGLLFAAAGGKQLSAAAQALTGETVNTIVGAVFLWVGTPVLAFALFFTVIGIPLAIGLLAFFLPAMGLLGYVVAGTRLGGAMVGLASRRDHPFAAAALGLLVLQLVLLIPGVGAVIALLAALWGAGALAFLGFRALRGGPGAAQPGEAPAPVATA
jgi:hypothetical protein